MDKSYLINCDMGESFGNYQIGNDDLLMPYINAANIACGMHAGDPLQIEKTIDLALKNQVTIGAHPGYPDLQGFGRRIIPMSSDELSASIRYQVAALIGMTRAKGGKVDYVKPHGALYNLIAKDADIAQTVISAIKDIDPSLKVMGLAGSHVRQLAEKNKMIFIAEAFADRAYEENGQLRSRKLEGAVLSDAEASLNQVLSIMTQGQLKTYQGNTIPLKAESFCVHGDNPAALSIAKKLNKKLL